MSSCKDESGRFTPASPSQALAALCQRALLNSPHLMSIFKLYFPLPPPLSAGLVVWCFGASKINALFTPSL